MHQILNVNNFSELVSTPFQRKIKAFYWKRELKGNFAEIVKKVEFEENMVTLEQEQLLKLTLTEQGKLARETLLNDFRSGRISGD